MGRGSRKAKEMGGGVSNPHVKPVTCAKTEKPPTPPPQPSSFIHPVELTLSQVMVMMKIIIRITGIQPLRGGQAFTLTTLLNS